MGPTVLLEAVPTLAGKVWHNVVHGKGDTYLLLIFMPLLGLPLVDPRWVLPATPPILLNLAATHGYQQEIRYQYLATAAPFLALATVAGLRVVARRRVVLASLLVALVALAGFIDYRVGPAPWSEDFPRPAEDGPVNQARRQALGLIDPAAPVSAHFNLAPHLAHRTHIYEFPNPFEAPNWGYPGDGTSRRRSSASAMWWSSALCSASVTVPCWTSSAVNPNGAPCWTGKASSCSNAYRRERSISLYAMAARTFMGRGHSPGLEHA